MRNLDKASGGVAIQPKTICLANIENANKVMTRGPLLSNTGEEQIGSLFLIDVPDMETARQFKDEMPFVKARLFSESVFHRWRFGRVYDRFKLTD